MERGSRIVIGLGVVALLAAVVTAIAIWQGGERARIDDATPTPSTTLEQTASPADRQGVIDGAGPKVEVPSTPSGPLVVATPGEVVDGGHYSWISVEAPDVTLRNVRVTSEALYAVKALEQDGLVIEDSYIDCTAGRGSTSACLYATGSVAVLRTRIVAIEADAIKSQGNAVFEGNFVRASKLPGSDLHADVLQIRQGEHIRIARNVFGAPAAEGGNAAVIIQTAESPISDVEIVGNWLNGGNYTVYTTEKKRAGHGCPTDVRITGNHFGRDHRYGIHRGCYDEWSGNTWADSGAVIPPP